MRRAPSGTNSQSATQNAAITSRTANTPNQRAAGP